MSEPGAALGSSPTEREAAELIELLRTLVSAAEVDAGPAELREAARAVAGLAGQGERLERAAASVGLRIGWVIGTPAETLPAARPDLPIVTRLASGWLLADGWRRRRVRVQRIPGIAARRWWPLETGPLAALDAEARTWALVEPALPAAPLSTTAPGAARLRPLQRLRALLRAEREDLVAITIYAVGVGILTLATPLVIQVLINWLAFGVLLQPLIALAVALLICLSLAAVLRGLERIAVEMVQRRIFIRMVSDVAHRMSRLRPEALDGRYGPELVNRIFDVLTVQKAVSTLMLDGLGAALQAGVGMVLLAIYHPALFGFDVVLVGALSVVLLVLGRGGERTAIAESKAKYQAAGWLEELARHPAAFRVGGADRLAVEQADALLEGWLENRRGHFRVFFRQYAGGLVVQVVASAALLLLAGALVLEGQLTLGQLVAAEFVVTAMLAGFVKFVEKLDAWYDLLAGVDKLGELVDLPRDEARGLSPVERGPATLALSGVRLRRADGALTPPLDLDIASGARLALLCGEGTPTTALAEVILGIRDPADGTVSRAGLDVRSWHPDALHRAVGLASGPELIHATLLDNVALGRPGVGEAEVWRALERTGLAERARTLPDGIRTRIGPTGAPLEAPQVVRLLLARAIAGEPQLVVVSTVLDGLPAGLRDTLLTAVTDDDAPWTLVVLTHDPDVAHRLPERRDLAGAPEGAHG